MEQGRRVDELHDRRELEMVAPGIFDRTGCEQEQRRPKTLAAAADDVLRDLPNEHHVRVEPAADQRIDLGHVPGDEAADGLQGGRGQAGVGRGVAGAAKDSTEALTQEKELLYNHGFS